MAQIRDEAFCFYYQENLDFLEREGWELIPVGPLHNKRQPCPGISAILLGGGYPEVYAKKLSENKAMLKELRMAKRQGIKILAECGGFPHLYYGSNPDWIRRFLEGSRRPEGEEGN